jgi:predicted nucleotidyltransferase
MGQIFRWDVVRTKHVPKRENFLEGITLMHREFVGCFAIASAVVLGSVIRNDFTRRSDLDVFYVYRDDLAREAWATTNAVAKKLQDRFSIKVNYVPCSAKMSTTPYHFFGPLFYEHLKRSCEMKGTIKGVLPSFPFQIPTNQEVGEYFKAKLHSFEETLSQVSLLSEEGRVEFLRKAFESPVHIARKMLLLREPLPDDSKKVVVNNYIASFPRGLSEHLQRLVNIDSMYTDALLAQLESPDEEKYQAVLDTLQNESYCSLEFLKGNIEHMARQ